MQDDYDTDLGLWSEHQAGLLRLRAAGNLVNEASLILAESPSLHPTLADVVAREMPRQRRLVAGLLALYNETPHLLLERLNYGPDQVVGPWLPEPNK